MLFLAELPWCCFCAEIKVLALTWKFMENFCGIYKNVVGKRYHRRATQEPQALEALSPPGRASQACGPPGAPATLTPTPYIPIHEEKNRKKDSSHFTIRSRRHLLFFIGRLIWSLFGAPEGGIRRHHHHQPSSITNFMMLTTGSE